MRRFLTILVLFGTLSVAGAADVSGHLAKILPLYLDLKGHDAISPSLFDRDAYQARLRQHPDEVSGIRFDILWNASDAKEAKLKLRVELRGVGEHGLPTQSTLEQDVTPKGFRSWTSLTLESDAFKQFGSLVAWRATLWNGDQLLAEQKSFLW